jgi:hypothetical protein
MIAFAFAIAMIADPVPCVRPARFEPPAPLPVTAPMLSSVAVTVECTAHADGTVDACEVLAETHPGLGFGEAAVTLIEGSSVEPGEADVRFARTIQFMP